MLVLGQELKLHSRKEVLGAYALSSQFLFAGKELKLISQTLERVVIIILALSQYSIFDTWYGFGLANLSSETLFGQTKSIPGIKYMILRDGYVMLYFT